MRRSPVRGNGEAAHAARPDRPLLSGGAAFAHLNDLCGYRGASASAGQCLGHPLERGRPVRVETIPTDPERRARDGGVHRQLVQKSLVRPLLHVAWLGSISWVGVVIAKSTNEAREHRSRILARAPDGASAANNPDGAAHDAVIPQHVETRVEWDESSEPLRRGTRSWSVARDLVVTTFARTACDPSRWPAHDALTPLRRGDRRPSLGPSETAAGSAIVALSDPHARSKRDEGPRQTESDSQGQLFLSGFHYKLHTPEGGDLGEFNTIVPNWTVGDTFTTGDGHTFRIVKMMPVDDGEDSIYSAFWMVEPVSG